jgi:hypothetical protein
MPKRQKSARAGGDDQNCAERDYGVLGPKAPSAKKMRDESH